MSKTNNQGSTCKSICWLLGMAAGGYLTYYLIYQMGQDRTQSGVIGIVTMLIVGLILRRLLCRSGKVKTVAPAASPAKAALKQAAVKTPAPRAARAAKGKSALKAETDKVAAKAAMTPPDIVAEVDRKLEEKVLAAATAAATTAASAATSDAATALRPAQDALGKSAGPEVEIAPQAMVLGDSQAVDEAAEDDADDVDDAYDWDEDEEAEFEALTKEEDDEDRPEPEAAPFRPDEPVMAASDAKALAEEPQPKAPQAEVEAEVEVEVEVVADTPEIKPMEPKRLDAPEGGRADDLTKIDGVGTELQAALNKAGIYHYAQFVTMNRRELAWLDQNLPGVDGQAVAESWRKHAIQLSRQAD